MPFKPLRPCFEPGCPSLVPSGYCPQHQHRVKEYVNDKRVDPFYVSAAWRALRDWQIRHFPLCAACGRPGNTADHIVPIKNGGEKLDQANLQTLCGNCHNMKRASER